MAFLRGSYHHEPGQHEASESSVLPKHRGAGSACPWPERNEKPSPRRAREPGCTVPPTTGGLTVCFLPLLSLSLSFTVSASLSFTSFPTVSFLTPFLTPLSATLSLSPPTLSLCKAARGKAHSQPPPAAPSPSPVPSLRPSRGPC